jgi:hypothetical protein
MTHLGADIVPMPASDVGVDLEAHVVGHIVLAHVQQSIQRVLPGVTLIIMYPKTG